MDSQLLKVRFASYTCALVCRLLLLIGPHTLAAQLVLSCRNVPDAQGRYQTEVRMAVAATALSFQAQGGRCATELRVRLLFRRADGRIPFQSERAESALLADDRYPELQWVTLERRLDLPAGSYSVYASWVEPASGLQLAEMLAHTVYPPSSENLLLGDGQLLLPSGEPLRGPSLPGDASTLGYRIAYRHAEARPFALRCILYRRQSLPIEDEARHYVSVLQSTQAQPAVQGLGLAEGSLSLQGLPPGQYLLELAALDDGRLLSTRTQEFQLAWRGRAALEAQPDSFLRLMAPLLSPGWLERQLTQASPAAQRRLIQTYWAARPQDLEDYPERALEQYFLAAEAVLARYPPRGDGQPLAPAAWELRLGPPDRIRRRSAEELWEYDSYLLELRLPRDEIGG